MTGAEAALEAARRSAAIARLLVAIAGGRLEASRGRDDVARLSRRCDEQALGGWAT